VTMCDSNVEAARLQAQLDGSVSAAQLRRHAPGAERRARAGTGFDASGPGSVLEALGVLAAIVGIHEAGHFAAARLQGIHVTKFAIGFGPPLLKYQARCGPAP